MSSARCWWDRNGRIRWPDRIPASRFGQLTGEPIDYTPTEPLVVVEVDADTWFEYERWRHVTTFLRVRGNLQPADVTLVADGWRKATLGCGLCDEFGEQCADALVDVVADGPDFGAVVSTAALGDRMRRLSWLSSAPHHCNAMVPL